MTTPSDSTKVCPYCTRPLDGSLEHVLLSCLGGHLTSTELLCSACNNGFGHTIDAALAAGVAFFTTVLDIQSGRGERAATLRNVPTKEGETINIAAGGVPEAPRLTFTETTDAQGQRRVQVRVGHGFEHQVVPAVRGWCEKHGVKLEELKIEAFLESEPAPTVDVQMAFGGDEQLRAITKMGLSFLSYHLGVEVLRGPEFSKALGYVKGMNCTPGPAEFSEVLGRYDVPDIHKTAPGVHRLVVSCNPDTGLVLFLVEMYGVVRFHAVLAEGWTGKPFSAAYSVDATVQGPPLQAMGFIPSRMTAKAMAAESQELGAVSRRLESLLRFATKRMEKAAMKNIAEGAVTQVLGKLPENTIITQEHTDELSRVVFERVATTFMGGKSRVPLDPATLLSGRSGKRRKK